MKEDSGRGTWVQNGSTRSAFVQAMAVGLLGGLAGTLAMDLVLAGLFSAVGMPTDLTFSFIGDTASIFLSGIGIPLSGGVPLGAVVHYVIGAVLGLIFGGAISQVQVLRGCSLLRSALLGILYIEIISQPILITAPILRSMTTAETLQWFGLSFFMHLICGAVLGLVVNYGLRSTAAK